MSADILRRAAALMRERAEAVQNWKRRYPEDSGGEYAFLTATFLENAIAEHAPGPTNDPHLREAWQRDGEHLASWHPAVALAVADWLDWLAPFARFGKDDPFVVKHGLAVARAYLGESA